MLNRQEILSASRAGLRQFRRDETGALVIFGLVLFFLMVMMGGLAIDLMRYEYTRTNLQNTLDRSTLAAAALNQKLTPKDVVADYMDKAGLSDQLASVTVTEVLNSRMVHSIGRADTHPVFLHLLGIDKLDAMGGSRAEQAITNVEIALVLDISGSMQRNNKIGNLKAAAADFVDTILANDPNHRVSITIVPYNAQVNIGPVLVSKFNITNHNDVANDNCIELPPSAYGTLVLSQTDPMPMMAYADIAYGTNLIDATVKPTSASAKPVYDRTFCKPNPANIIRLPSNDATQLKSEINALQAEGNTSITLGMKWGVTLLDPSMRPMFTDLIASGDVPKNMPARPFDYNDTSAMKIVVLMTDGEHVQHERITNGYKTGPSPIYLSKTDGSYSVFFDTKVDSASAAKICASRPYWVPHLSAWQSRPWNSTAPASTDCYDKAAATTGVAQQDWKDIWANLKLTYVAWQFYGRALGTTAGSRTAAYTDALTKMRAVYADVATMDTTLQQSCTGAKDRGVIVYGIAFEAPAHGQDVIKACASSTANYFAADGVEIKTAFQTIASNITMLKLTQ